jgi:hypothetical protein
MLDNELSKEKQDNDLIIKLRQQLDQLRQELEKQVSKAHNTTHVDLPMPPLPADAPSAALGSGTTTVVMWVLCAKLAVGKGWGPRAVLATFCGWLAPRGLPPPARPQRP